MLRNNLAKLMIDRGVTATQLFNDTGIARSTISKISNNNTDKISLQTVDKICNYLEVEPSDFFDFFPYDVKISCGLVNFDTLAEARESKFGGLKYEEPAFLLIEFSRGNNNKRSLEYKFNYKEDSIADKAFIGELDEIILASSIAEATILDDMPVQFQNDLIEEIKKTLENTFNLLPFTHVDNIGIATLKGQS